MPHCDQVLGCIYGLAIGDALGFPVEFYDLAAILKEFGPDGISDLITPYHGRFPLGTYSDDTQMSLAVANGLLTSKNVLDVEDVMQHITKEFIGWCNSPTNNRFAGRTCISGCKNLERGIHWKESGSQESKGCGAAMRTAPIGLFYENIGKVVEISYAASICTHAHPTGVATGIATAVLVHLALHHCPLEQMIEHTVEMTNPYDTLHEFSAIMQKVKKVVHEPPATAIPQLGQGWIGEEAVAISLYAFLHSPQDFRKTLVAAVNLTGDSDSTGSIAGAISGAYNGIAAIPKEWCEKIENASGLSKVANAIWNRRQ